MKKSPNDAMYQVAIKFMYCKENFNRELEARLDDISITCSNDEIEESWNKFESDHVVPMYCYHKDVPDIKGKISSCLVLGRGSKSLYQIIVSERIAGFDTNKILSFGLDLAKAIEHLHMITFRM